MELLEKENAKQAGKVEHLERLLKKTVVAAPTPSSPGSIEREHKGRAAKIFRAVWRYSVGAITGAAAVLGLVSGFAAMIPRIVITQSQALDSKQPFSTPFVVANDGPLPMMHVTFACVVGQGIDYSSGVMIRVGEPFNVGFSDAQQTPVDIDPGERATTPCANPPNALQGDTLVQADIAIDASYRIGYTPFHRRVLRRFQTSRAADGNLYWFALPLKPLKLGR